MKVLTNPDYNTAVMALVAAARSGEYGHTVITHNGVFHAHEVFACALVAPQCVIRTRDPAIIELVDFIKLKSTVTGGWFPLGEKAKEENENHGEVLVIDVGMKADGFILDHHQYEGYQSYDRMFFLGGSRARDAYDKESWLSKLLDDIGRMDCGLPGNDYVTTTIKKFNPTWNMDVDDEFMSILFEAAYNYAEIVLGNPQQFIWMKGWMDQHQKAEKLAREKAKEDLTRGYSIIVMDRYYPIMDYIHEFDSAAYFVIYPDLDGKSYRLQAVAEAPDGKNIPGKLRRSIDMPNLPGVTFIHKNRFIAGFDTQENAIKAAAALLNWPKYKNLCDGCNFLGRYKDIEADREYDVYECELEGTITIRYGERAQHTQDVQIGEWLDKVERKRAPELVQCAKDHNHLPKFRHDCDVCTFLGGYYNESDRTYYDLYYCDKIAARPTLIARWDDQLSHYQSGMDTVGIPALEKAKELAMERGLI